ncbi:hypothetical protein KKC44_02405 [Patescibacteria group bacterium]|nr:hypothetical protein [Patescibacteria group bacterium]
MSNDAPPQVPPEPRLVDTISDGAKEGVQLALVDINRERARDHSIEEKRKLLAALHEKTIQAQDPEAEKELTQWQTELENEMQENEPKTPAAPETTEQADAPKGNYFERTMENVQKLIEEEKMGFSQRTTAQNIMRYTLATALIAGAVYLCKWIKDETGKVGAAVAVGLLSVGAAIGINKCAEELKKREAVAVKEGAQPQEPKAGAGPAQVSEGGENGVVSATGVETANQSADLLSGTKPKEVEVSGSNYIVNITPSIIEVDGKKWKLQGLGKTTVTGIETALWQNKILNLVIKGYQPDPIFGFNIPGKVELELKEGAVAGLLSHLSKEETIYMVPPKNPGEESKAQIVPA